MNRTLRSEGKGHWFNANPVRQASIDLLLLGAGTTSAIVRTSGTLKTDTVDGRGSDPQLSWASDNSYPVSEVTGWHIKIARVNKTPLLPGPEMAGHFLKHSHEH
jgi:hypothetical protein